MFFPQEQFAVVDRLRFEQSVAQTKAAVENGDSPLLFWNKFAIEKNEHARFLTQTRMDAEKKVGVQTLVCQAGTN